MNDAQESADMAKPDGQLATSDPIPNTAPPSTSVLSDAPTSEPTGPSTESQDINPGAASADDTIQVSKRYPAASAQPLNASGHSHPPNNALGIAATEWEAARAKVMDGMATTQSFEQASQQVPDTPRDIPKPKNRGGRPRKRASLLTHGAPSTPATSATTSAVTPVSTGRARGVGRGRGGGRPRKRGGPTATGRGGKRKRADDDENASVSPDHSDDSSDEVVETTIQTKSGRAVQKPTSFVPPPNPSPSTDKPVKRRRAYHRNPQSALCKVCLRGTSPESNMIVFCDGCNTPWHQYCHFPPILKAVVQQVDAEWFCRQCETDRAAPVTENIPIDTNELVSAQGVTEEERKRYFVNLPPNQLVTLLVKATTMHPSLPLFNPTQLTKLKQQQRSSAFPPNSQPIPTNSANNSLAARKQQTADDFDRIYTPDVHPPHYPRPGYGLMATLPPDDEDETLVDDQNSLGVFSHVYLVDGEGVKQAVGDGVAAGDAGGVSTGAGNGEGGEVVAGAEREDREEDGG
ncbi:hypothetical protein MBLNU230_g8217t1 [Neophaeotheca triangularis]